MKYSSVVRKYIVKGKQKGYKKEKLPCGSFSLDIGYDTKGRAIFPDIGLDIYKFS